MFSPRYNQSEDLDEYERMRQQALTYNPEMGDTGASAPRADTAYNPEMGDTGANAPRGQSSDEAIDAAYAQDPGAFETERAPTPAVGSHLWMRPGPGLYNPEEGDLASNAPVAPAMSADEAGRRLPAPPPAFTPQEAQAQLAPMPYSGPLQRPVAPPSRVAQAAQPMQQPVSRTLQRPQSAASEQYDPGQAPPSALATFIRSLPGNIANIASAASSSKHRASPYALQGIQQRNAENDQAFAQDEQARQAFGVRKQQLARLKSQDEIQAQRAQAMAKRQGVADTRAATEFQQGQQDRQWSLEARDPNSQKSQLFRQAVEQAHPELKAAIGEAQWAQLSPANAAMIAPLIEKGQAEAAATAKEKARIQGLADKKELLKYRQDIKKPTINIGLRGAGPEAVSAVEQQIADYFGGADKIPDTVKLDMAQARNQPMKVRAKEMGDVAQRVAGQGIKGANQTAKDTAAQTKADQKQSEDYAKESRLRGIDRVRAPLAIVKQTLAKYKGKDIPGYGQTGMLLPAVLSAEGKSVRGAVEELLDTKLRVATGAAAPESEQKAFRQTLGIGPLATDNDLRNAVKRIDDTLAEHESYMKKAYPNARQARGEAAPAQGGGGTVSMRDKDGNHYDIPAGEASEAEKDGLTRE